MSAAASLSKEHSISNQASRLAGTLPLLGQQQTRVRSGRFDRLLRRQSTRRYLITTVIVSGNMIILAAVITAIVLGANRTTATNAALPVAKDDPSIANPLDHVSSASIAETVAQANSLPEATAVTNQADSETITLAMAPTSASVVDKPQVVSTAGFASNKDIKTYVTAAGDTITSIANKVGVTSDSIRWSNNLKGDSVAAGTSLQIPPVTGIVYTVQAGDTATTLAVKYKADQNKITAFNDAEIAGLTPGEKILIPDGSIAAAVASTTKATSAATWNGTAAYGYNGYDFGYCTYWVAKLRAAAGNPVPTNLGNASTWAIRAAAMGLPTGTTPRVGAAVVTQTGGAGHVAYVTGVNDDGSIVVSEMNFHGWNRTDSRTLSGSGLRYVY